MKNKWTINKKQIKLTEIKSNIDSIQKFSEELILNLGDSIFKYPSMQILIFNVLKQISPINKSLKLDDSSINSACEKVLNHFGLNKKVSLKRISNNGTKEIVKTKSFSEKFCQSVLFIDKLPAEIYNSLVTAVNCDLKSITELILWYEKKSCIVQYINTNKIPYKHEERTIFDFYKRCLEGRNEIINYQLNDLKKRAIIKCKYNPLGILNNTNSFISHLYDFPYKYARHFSSKYFNYQHIDKIGHRLIDFHVFEAHKLETIYRLNPINFYKKYFKRITVEQHFQDLNFHLNNLPLIKNRTLIFEELKILFKKKHWIGFYALALPQIEGLFAEMCLIIDHKKDLRQKELPHKVNSIQSFKKSNIDNLDYFQYCIPSLRNEFSHTGYDENFQLKSFDLLVDLRYLLKKFYELDHPYIKITQIFNRKNSEEFNTIFNFIDYFELINTLNDSQKIKLKSDIINFENNFLALDCEIEYISKEMLEKLKQELNELANFINQEFKKYNYDYEFESLNFSEMTNLINDKSKFDVIENCFNIKFENLEYITQCISFIKLSKTHLPSLNNKIKNEFIEFTKNNKLILDNLYLINYKLNLNSDLN